jgi:hypothetical protein
LAAPYPSSLLYRWPLDEGSGLTASEETGSGKDLTLASGSSQPTWVTGSNLEGGTGLSFDGNDDQASTTAIQQADAGSQDFTIAFTLDLSSTPLPKSSSINYFHNTTGNELFGIGPDGNASGGLGYDFRDSGGNKVEQNSVDLSGFGGLIRVCLVVDSSTGTVTPFVNATNLSKSGGVTNTSNLGTGFFVGNNDFNNPGDCLIDNIAFYTSALTTSEVQSDFNAQDF